jgi:hypothetical protein
MSMFFKLIGECTVQFRSTLIVLCSRRGTEFTGLVKAMRDRGIHLVFKGVRL